MVLFRRFAARTRIKRASAEALSQPLFGMRRQSSIDSSAIDLPSGTAPPVAATQAGSPRRAQRRWRWPLSHSVNASITPVLSSRSRHTGWQIPIDPSPMLSGSLTARTGV